MHNQHSPHIDQATIDRWQADGAVLLKGVFTPWVERLAEGVTALMAQPQRVWSCAHGDPQRWLAAFFSGLLQLVADPGV